MSGTSLSILIAPSNVAYVATQVLALGGGAWRLRDRGAHKDWALSLACSTAAAAPGALVLIELGSRVIASLFIDAILTFPPAALTLLVCWLWALVFSPVLMFIAVFVRARGTPGSIYALQLVQLVAWCWSVPVTLVITLQA